MGRPRVVWVQLVHNGIEEGFQSEIASPAIAVDGAANLTCSVSGCGAECAVTVKSGTASETKVDAIRRGWSVLGIGVVLGTLVGSIMGKQEGVAAGLVTGALLIGIAAMFAVAVGTSRPRHLSVMQRRRGTGGAQHTAIETFDPSAGC